MLKAYKKGKEKALNSVIDIVDLKKDGRTKLISVDKNIKTLDSARNVHKTNLY